MSAFLSALKNGFSPTQIVQYFQKNFPSLSGPIAKATASGYTAEKILSYLSNNLKPKDVKGLLPNEIDALKKEQDNTSVKRTLASLASYGVGRLSQAGAGAAANIAGGANPPGTPGAPGTPPIGPAPMANAPGGLGQQVNPRQPTPTNQPAIVNPNAGQQPPQPQGVVNPALQRQNMIHSLQAATPEFREYALKEFDAGSQKSIDELIKDFQAEQKNRAKAAPNPFQEQVQTPQKTEKIAQEQITNATPQKIEKGAIVSTPSGNVGEIHDVKQNEALVNEDGKLHKVKLSDLQMPDEKVQQTVARLLEIPEIDKSALISYWAYDPQDKELLAMYHNGETYKYTDVPEELEKELLEATVTPKTEGENIFGAWSQEDIMSRGATLSKLFLTHPKYKKAKKGEPANPFYRKLRKGYDYWSKLRK